MTKIKRQITHWKVIPLSRLRIGQRFNWVPAQWFGEGRLTHKSKRVLIEFVWKGERLIPKKSIVYDLKYHAAVVNPPAVDYGIKANTKVKVKGSMH